jgi:hypothetical protein
MLQQFHGRQLAAAQAAAQFMCGQQARILHGQRPWI